MTNRRLSTTACWTLMAAGCNAAEIADYCGVSRVTAVSMMAAAARKHADGAR